MGSSGGTTVVIIVIHLIKSFSFDLFGSYIPWYNTYPEQIIAKTSKINIRIYPSVFLTALVLYNTVLIIFPFSVSNPVLRT